jgi:hypothetical protein
MSTDRSPVYVCTSMATFALVAVDGEAGAAVVPLRGGAEAGRCTVACDGVDDVPGGTLTKLALLLLSRLSDFRARNVRPSGVFTNGCAAIADVIEDTRPSAGDPVDLRE